MKTVLCFGDSNTWGYDALGTQAAGYPVRHGPAVRWTGVLGGLLGPEFRVVEEGQNGRTTVFEDPLAAASRNGRVALPMLLESQKPIDLVIVMLGTNDLKTHLGCPAADIANGVALLGKMVLTSDAGPANKAPRLLLVCPAAIGNLDHMPELASRLDGAYGKSRQLPGLIRTQAGALGAAFLNAQEHTRPCKEDGIHLDAASHAALGTALADAVRAVLAG
jgi:lysophospholipase L1-like esterase